MLHNVIVTWKFIKPYFKELEKKIDNQEEFANKATKMLSDLGFDLIANPNNDDKSQTDDLESLKEEKNENTQENQNDNKESSPDDGESDKSAIGEEEENLGEQSSDTENSYKLKTL